MRTLLLSRRYAGIGDWLMSLAVLHMVNRQRPDVDVRVSFDTPDEPLPSIVPEAFAASDVVYRTDLPERADLETGHFVYRSGSARAPFIADMVDVLNERTGLGIHHEAGEYPRFKVEKPVPVAGYDYIAMVAHGKRISRRKEWLGFGELAEQLRVRADVPIIQIGAAGDERLPGAAYLLGAPFAAVARTLAGARAFVGIENGLMVLAGFLGVPQLTIYGERGNPDRLVFPNQIQIRHRASVHEIAERVLACL